MLRPVNLSLHCSDLSENSYCAQRYGGNGQLDRIFKFNVKKDKGVKTSSKAEDAFIKATLSSLERRNARMRQTVTPYQSL